METILLHRKTTKGEQKKVKRIVSVETYIGLLGECLKARNDFKSFRYYRSASGDEYAVLTDIIGGVLILDITGYNRERILQNVAEIITGRMPSNAVTDRTRMLEIARLFK